MVSLSIAQNEPETRISYMPYLHATDLSLQKPSCVRDEATSPVYAAAPPTSGVKQPGRRRQNDAVQEISSSTPEPAIAITQPMYRAARLCQRRHVVRDSIRGPLRLVGTSRHHTRDVRGRFITCCPNPQIPRQGPGCCTEPSWGGQGSPSIVRETVVLVGESGIRCI